MVYDARMKQSDTILVVDDDEPCATYLADVLRSEGYGKVAVFHHPLEAFKHIIRDELPGFIVTDFPMPGMNGDVLLDEVAMLHGSVNAVVVTCDPVEARTHVWDYPVIDKNTPDFGAALCACVRGALADRAMCQAA